MIENIILDYLLRVLDYPVFLEVPEVMPERFVIIDKTGSSMDNYLKGATIAIQSYGLSMYDSALMNEQIKDAMESIINLDEIARCKLQNDYPFTNVSIKRYRYQALFDMTYY